MGWENIISDNLGVSWQILVMLATFFFGLIISAKDIKIGAMTWTLLYLVEFAGFYELDSTNIIGWRLPLIAFFICIVLMCILLFTSYLKHSENSIT